MFDVGSFLRRALADLSAYLGNCPENWQVSTGRLFRRRSKSKKNTENRGIPAFTELECQLRFLSSSCPR